MKAVGYYGSCVGPMNPGHGGAGHILLTQDGKELRVEGKYLGENKSAFVAEYSALLFILKTAVKLGVTELDVHGSMTLIINQITGKWAVKDENLYSLVSGILVELKKFDVVRIKKIPREKNLQSIELAEEAISPYTDGETEYFMAKNINGIRFQWAGSRMYKVLGTQPEMINMRLSNCTCDTFAETAMCEHIEAVQIYETQRKEKKTRDRKKQGKGSRAT